jgi:hypothetical protein
MGIQIEFNPDLALRKFGAPNRLEEECLPENFEEGKIYSFLKKGQRNYWLNGEIPLLETKGNEQLSDPLASIIILEAKHFKKENEIYTQGKYQLIKKINLGEIYFNGINKI